MKKLFRLWARVFILATSKIHDVPMHRLKAHIAARLLVMIIPPALLGAHLLLISFFPALIHFSAVMLLLILIPMFIVGIRRMHKLKVYFQRKQNTQD